MSDNSSVLVSVVVPLFNKEQYVKSAIESILKQTFTEFEIIIVDDGSTDNSISIVKSFSDARIKIISQVNGGVSSARNTGINNSSGTWIAFLDADDLWDKSFLFTFKNIAEKYKTASLIGVNYGYVDLIDNISPYSNIYKEGILNDVYFDYCLLRYPFNSSSIIVRKKCFEELGGFRVDLKEGEDLEMWYRIIKNDRDAYYCPKVLSFYRKDNQNQKRRQRSILLKNFWGFHINFENITNESELVYLYKRIISLCKIVIFNKNSISNTLKIVERYGLKTILFALYKVIKYKTQN